MTKNKKSKVIVIGGPTASGKSTLAIEVALKFDGEIVNADSVQVYKYLDIGSAKPNGDDRSKVPHHLIDILNPDEDFSAADFKRQSEEAIEDILSRGKLPIVVGGTGLYIRALTEGIFEGPSADPAIRAKLENEIETDGLEKLYERLKEVDLKSTEKIHRNNRHRIIRALEVYMLTGVPLSKHHESHREEAEGGRKFDFLKIALKAEMDELKERIALRTDEMFLDDGLIKEVEKILSLGYTGELKSFQTLGYREVIKHLSGDLSKEDTIELVKKNTRLYAKRQLTWFRKEPNINWFNVRDKADIITTIEKFLKDN